MPTFQLAFVAVTFGSSSTVRRTAGVVWGDSTCGDEPYRLLIAADPAGVKHTAARPI